LKRTPHAVAMELHCTLRYTDVLVPWPLAWKALCNGHGVCTLCMEVPFKHPCTI